MIYLFQIIPPGLEFQTNDPKNFITCSKDNTLYANSFESAERPADKANPVSVHMDTTGRILHATSNKVSVTVNGKSKM